MAEHWELIKEAPIKNNCTECYNQNLVMRFKQKHLRTRIYHRTSGEVREELHCNTCGSRIYPVSWTPDIENSVNYYRKMAIPDKPGIRFGWLFYVLLLFLISLIGAAVYTYREGMWSI